MVIIVMGVSGSGKTTVGALAERMEAVFLEGDAFHSPETIDKMESGVALTDEDRGAGRSFRRAGDPPGTAQGMPSFNRANWAGLLDIMLMCPVLLVEVREAVAIGVGVHRARAVHQSDETDQQQ